jgi:hypothetical protein
VLCRLNLASTFYLVFDGDCEQIARRRFHFCGTTDFPDGSCRKFIPFAWDILLTLRHVGNEVQSPGHVRSERNQPRAQDIWSPGVLGAVTAQLTGRTTALFTWLVVRVPHYRSTDSGFDSPRYHIFSEVVVLKRGSLSLVRITEEHLNEKFAAAFYKTETNADYTTPFYSQKLAVTSSTSGARSVGKFRLRTEDHGVSL